MTGTQRSKVQLRLRLMVQSLLLLGLLQNKSLITVLPYVILESTYVRRHTCLETTRLLLIVPQGHMQDYISGIQHYHSIEYVKQLPPRS